MRVSSPSGGKSCITSTAQTMSAGTWYGLNSGKSASADYQFWVAPFNCTLQNLMVEARNNVAAGESLTITIYDRATGDTVLTCIMGAGTNTAEDTTHSVSVTKRETYCFKYVASGGYVNDYISASVEVSS